MDALLYINYISIKFNREKYNKIKSKEKDVHHFVRKYQIANIEGVHLKSLISISVCLWVSDIYLNGLGQARRSCALE